LHPKLRLNNVVTKALVDAVLFDYPTVPLGFYCVYDINELNDDVDDEDCFSVIGLGDFFFFDLLLLVVIPDNSSITTRACIAFGCMISVQFSDLCTGSMFSYVDSPSLPALPIPTIVVTAYAIVIDAIIQYSSMDCDDPLKWKKSLL
jgi:hypothetical protein